MPTGSVGQRVASMSPATVKYLVAGLVLVMFVLAVGHLYVIPGLTSRAFGLPLWVYVEVVVVAVLLVIAWIVVQLITSRREAVN